MARASPYALSFLAAATMVAACTTTSSPGTPTINAVDPATIVAEPVGTLPFPENGSDLICEDASPSSGYYSQIAMRRAQQGDDRIHVMFLAYDDRPNGDPSRLVQNFPEDGNPVRVEDDGSFGSGNVRIYPHAPCALVAWTHLDQPDHPVEVVQYTPLRPDRKLGVVPADLVASR